MAVNYTPEMVDTMKQRYSANPTRETVEELANELNKSIKSVIGKLSREGAVSYTHLRAHETKANIVFRNLL